MCFSITITRDADSLRSINSIHIIYRMRPLVVCILSGAINAMVNDEKINRTHIYLSF